MNPNKKAPSQPLGAGSHLVRGLRGKDQPEVRVKASVAVGFATAGAVDVFRVESRDDVGERRQPVHGVVEVLQHDPAALTSARVHGALRHRRLGMTMGTK